MDLTGDPISAFCAYCAAIGRAESTVYLRRRYLLRLSREADLMTVDEAGILSWVAAQSWGVETRKSAGESLAQFFSWAQRHGLRPDNPVADLTWPAKRGCAHPAPEAVIAAARLRATPEERLMIDLAAMAGLRRAEIAGLHSTQLEGDVLRIEGKADRVRVVPIPLPLVARVEARGPGWIFPGRLPGRHTTPDHVGRVLSRLLGPGFTGHTLRHRYATRVYDETADILALQRLLGHASAATTQRYVEVPMRRLRAAALTAAS